MSNDGPLFRVIGPDGEEPFRGYGREWAISERGQVHTVNVLNEYPRPLRIEWLRDPRPCAEAVQAVVEAATRWAAGRSQCPLCNDQIPLCPACTLVRAIADLLTHDAFDRAKVAVAPIIEREREGEDVGAVMDLRLD